MPQITINPAIKRRPKQHCLRHLSASLPIDKISSFNSPCIGRTPIPVSPEQGLPRDRMGRSTRRYSVVGGRPFLLEATAGPL
ncbi:MAG: hypothetical protein IPN89_09650 [Saprospiraceae bacterium]|nr:hypothetical protein [Saprospiraceae bacterium]